MKKILLFQLFAFFYLSNHAQSLAFAITPSIQCAAQYTTIAQCSVTSSAPGTTSYSWSLLSSGSPTPYTTLIILNGSHVAFSYLPVGVTTVICSAYSGNSITSTSTNTLMVYPSPIFTINSSNVSNICSGTTVTLSASTAGNYTWLPTNTVGNSLVVTPTANTCYTAVTGNTFGCTYSVSTCINVASAAPVLTLSSAGNFSLCGNVGYLSASGASSYTWSTNYTMNNGWVNPFILLNGLGCYSVTGSNGCGTATAQACATGTAPPPSVSVVGPSTICTGQSAVLTANGMNTYTAFYWYAGIPSSSVSSQISTTYSALISPTATTCYTLQGQNIACGNQTTHCVNVLAGPLPTINISASPSQTICFGGSVTLTASGANTYTWNTGTIAPSISLNPTVSTCYIAMGTNSLGCTNTATSCITLTNTPVTVSPTLQSVCIGSSISFTASGANSYLWSTTPSVTTPTLNVFPLVSTNYSVFGTFSNNCLGMSTVAVVVNTTCSDVWPGDANSDGVVNSTDVFEIGLGFNSTGSNRSPGGNSYNSQYCSNWTGTVSTGKNKCHADCNGDGTINLADTFAIFTNFSLTHPFKSSENSSTSADLQLYSEGIYAEAGKWSKMDVRLGSVTNQQTQLYGVAFDLMIDQSMIETDSVYILYNSSFINASNQNVEFRKLIFSSGVLHAVTVRTNGLNVNGFGKIGEIWFKVKNGLPNFADLNFGLSNASKTDNAGFISSLTTDGILFAVNNNLSGIEEADRLHNSIRFFPNPAKNVLTLQSSMSGMIFFNVFDILGREVLKGEFSNSKTIDLSSFANGTYVIKLESEGSSIFKKLVVEK